MQMELTQILRDKPNPAFHSKYASLEAIDKAARPIYTKYGFSITYGTAPSSHDGWVQVTCRLAHRSGHSEVNCLEGPVSTEGARGGRIGATPIQAVGIAVSYLRRYLLQLTLNLVTASDVADNDGNGIIEPPAKSEPNYAEIVGMFETAAGRIKDSDEARKLMEWRPGVAAITGLPHGEERQRYMLMRSRVQADWMTKDDGASASEDIEGL
jgi:lysophospholipase L1-like esterase